MLKRKMYRKLEEWKASSQRKVLLLLGARQTGKTFIVREFARNSYDAFIEVNFLDDEENGRFLAGATSAEELISRLSLIVGHAIQPGTLVFFDEVQNLGHDIVTLSKFLLDDGRFDLVLSGSLLGTVLDGATSFPVGYARILRMHPLDFEEFCWAMGVPDAIIEEVRVAYREKRPLDEPLHDRLVRIHRQYIVVGGMPEAVQGFLGNGRDLGEPRQVGTDIVEQYRYDIIKYAPGRKMQICTIFDSVPGQLAKVNKRFVFNLIKKSATFDSLEDYFSWLVKSGVTLPAYLVTEPKAPLLRTKVQEKFKLYASDCGLLLSQYSLASSRSVLEGVGDANFGAVYENIVAQQLASAGFPLFYYNNNRKGEVDFLIESAEGKVLPIEVKSGKDYKRHMALNNLLDAKGFDVSCAYVLSEFNVSVGERAGRPVYYLPLYMTFCLEEERGNNLEGFVLEEISFDDWG